MPRPRRELSSWEKALHARCASFVRGVMPTLAPEVHAHVTQRVFVAMHKTLQHCVTLPGLEPNESTKKE